LPTNTTSPAPIRVAIVGLGAIGRAVATRLDRGVPGLEFAAACVRDEEQARSFLSTLGKTVPIVPLSEVALHAAVVVECAPAAALPDIAGHALGHGRTLVVVSVGALLASADIVERARRGPGRILVPTGALIGLDAMCAAAEGTIHSVRLLSRKPLAGLIGAPYLREHAIDITGLSVPVRVFEGSAREAAAGFPSNLNVAAALALAGIGADRTRVELWADPTIDRNIHSIEVDSDAARFRMTIENIPSENPRTGRITAQSVVALLRKLTAPLCIGT